MLHYVKIMAAICLITAFVNMIESLTEQLENIKQYTYVHVRSGNTNL